MMPLKEPKMEASVGGGEEGEEMNVAILGQRQRAGEILIRRGGQALHEPKIAQCSSSLEERLRGLRGYREVVAV